MVSFKSSFLAAAATFATLAAAQNDYVVDPETVDKGTRERWCQDQTNTCPSICAQTSDGDPLVNECNPDKLNYGCICSDEKKPNMTEYSLTLPFHMCQEWGNQCVAACDAHDNSCASDCRENNPCGAQEPKQVSSSAGAPTATPTGGADGDDEDDEDRIYDGLAGDDDDDDDDLDGSGGNSAAAGLTVGRDMGFVVLAASLFGGFAFML